MKAEEWTELQNIGIVQYLAAELLARLEARTVPVSLRGTPTLRRVRHALRDLGEELDPHEVALVAGTGNNVPYADGQQEREEEANGREALDPG